MKKNKIKNTVMLAAAVFAMGLFFSVKASAQSTYYNGGTYINQMIRDRMNARRRAAIYAARKKPVKKKVVRRAVRRKTRRVS